MKTKRQILTVEEPNPNAEHPNVITVRMTRQQALRQLTTLAQQLESDRGDYTLLLYGKVE
jgi:hypothetical protein